MNGLSRRRLAVLAIVVLATAAAVGWWRLRPGLDPPIPEGIVDDEVAAAIQSARQNVMNQPRSAKAWGDLGKTLLAHLFADEADVCFAEAARLAPDEPLWPYSRGVIALKQKPESAVALLEQAYAIGGPDSADRSAMTLQLAEALFDRGKLDEAEALFRAEHERSRLFRVDSEERAAALARAAFGRGLVAKARRDFAAASKFMLEAQVSQYARKKATSQLAAIARQNGDVDAALAHERQAATLPEDPPWPDPILDEVVHMQVGRRGLERQAGRLEKQGHFREAADLYLKQLAVNPTTEYRIAAAINLARLRDYDEALRLLREAVQSDPDAAYPRYALGHVLFARAERESQERPGAKEVREWFQEAADQSRLAAERRPDDARAHLFWGLSLKYLDKNAEAVAPLQKGLASAPADFELHLALGEVLSRLDRPKEAEIHLKNAQRLKPSDPRPAKILEKQVKK